MNPSKEAIEKAEKAYIAVWKNPKIALWTNNSLEYAIEAAYAIDVTPLEENMQSKITRHDEEIAALEKRIDDLIEDAASWETTAFERQNRIKELEAENQQLKSQLANAIGQGGETIKKPTPPQPPE